MYVVTKKKQKTKKTDIRLEMLMHIRQNLRVMSEDDVRRDKEKRKNENDRYLSVVLVICQAIQIHDVDVR